MNLRKSKVMLTIFVLLLFPLTTCLTISVKANIPDDSQLLLNGTGSYSEDFTTVTYKSALTTASGWGTGIVTKERDFSWDILDFYPTVNPVFDIEVQGRKVYSAYYNASGGVSTIGAYNLNNPQDIRFCSARGSWQQMLTIAVDGDVLYSGKHKDAIGAISTYNTSNAYALGVGTVFLDYTEADGSITDIEPDGHIVYYTAYNSTSGRSFRVIDTTNPDDQVNITNSWSSSQALGLAISGQLAYVAASTEGFYILNVSNKYAPVEIGYLDTPGNATEVIVDGGLAYLADGDAGVHIIDIRNPTNPSIIGTYNTPGNAQNLALQGRTLFVADGQAGVQVLDVADPTHPAFVTEISPLAYVYDIDLYGGILVVGAAEGIFTIRCA
ncbi:MAG: LVIVD repeat-containing protein, partial [Candidatus Heimdallarchaeota archaeon]